MLNTGSVPTLESQCNAPCLGQGGDICGGSGRISVYQYSTPPSPSPTPSATPPLNLIADGGFEGSPATYGSPTDWTIVTDVTSANYTWNFADTTLAHSGTNSVSLGYAYPSWMTMDWRFTQPVTLIPNRRYKLTAWSRGSGTGSITGVETWNCRAHYGLLAGPSSYVLYTRNRLDERVWYQSLGYFANSAGLTAVTFSVRVACDTSGATPVGGFKFHIDDVKLELVPEGKNFIG